MSNELVEDLAKLSTKTLLVILDGLHDCAPGPAKKPIKQILWDREGNPIIEWPSWYALPHNAPKYLEAVGLSSTHIAAFCPKADRLSDPEHRPWRELSLDRLDELQCSCGHRWTFHMSKRSQRYGSARVWPVQLINNVSCFVVCPYANAADDPLHAPTSSCRCICGMTLDPDEMPEGKALRYLPEI